jgi:xylulose-5-phosphate/fructose-6-phosphate phosphoketolase
VRGYKEEGTTTTPFDMVMLNDIDRYHLVLDVVDRVPGLGSRYAGLRQRMQDARVAAREYTRAHGEDIPVVADWTWGAGTRVDAREANTGVGRPAAGMPGTGGDNEP